MKPLFKNRPLFVAAALIILAVGIAIFRSFPQGGPVDESTTADHPGKPAKIERGENHRPARGGPIGESTESLPDPGFASESVAAILGDPSLEDAALRNRLLDAVRSEDLSLDERSEALDHALRLSLGDDLEPLVTLASLNRLPATLQNQLFEGSMDFSEKVQLRIAGAMLEHADKPQADAIIEHLEFLTDAEHDRDVAAWLVEIQTRLGP